MAINIDPVGAEAVRVAQGIGIFRLLETSPATIEQLARISGASPRGLRPLLYLLSSLELVTQEEERFRLGDDCLRYLAQEWPDREAELDTPADWKELERAVMTGSCVRSPIEGEVDAGGFFKGVVDTLFRLHSKIAVNLATHLPSQVLKTLDLGAGSAVWSLGLMSQRDTVETVAVDHPEVLQSVTRRFVEEHGLSSRYELRPGSYHTVKLEPDRYDLVYLGHVIHSEGWEASRSLLARCLDTLKPGGTLAIAEWVGSEPRAEDYHANLFDLNMLMFTRNGLVFTAREMEELCKEAGFQQMRWIPGPGEYPVLLVTKPHRRGKRPATRGTL
jgi:SAM-dependent methyltransferase